MVRKEKDSFGEKEVPDDAYYGVGTLRSVDNFPVSGEVFPLKLVHAMAQLKHSCAAANMTLGTLDEKKGKAIQQACEAVVAGELDDQFLIDVYQAGSGTSSNMNVNEVIANKACEILGGEKGDRSLIHPNDHVNKGQSTNNIVPSAIKVASYHLSEELLKALDEISDTFAQKEKEFSSIIKSGRTHLQDAVPVTLGQEFGAYKRALVKAKSRVEESRVHILELGVGGNAIGTGVNTKKEYRTEIMKALGSLTGVPYTVAENGIEITQFLTDIAHVSSSLRLLSLDLLKILNDLRLLSSGPNTGIAEIVLPPVEPGSSIMPGKINPSIGESANMACMQVLGYDHAVAIATGAGQLELNTHMPLVGYNMVKSFQLLTSTCLMVAQKCVSGITANEDVCRTNFEWSGGLATILNPKLGYDKVAELVKESLKTKKNLKELVLEKEIMSEKDFEALLENSTGPNL